MIRGKKTENRNKRNFYTKTKFLGSIYLSEGSCYVLVDGARFNIKYQLKKDIRDYNPQYIARVARKYFLMIYNDLTHIIVNRPQVLSRIQDTQYYLNHATVVLSTDKFIQEGIL